jgi:hypothetical protein
LRSKGKERENDAAFIKRPFHAAALSLSPALSRVAGEGALRVRNYDRRYYLPLSR